MIVGHYLDYAVIRDELGKLYLNDDKDGILQTGDVYMGINPRSVSCLTVSEQKAERSISNVLDVSVASAENQQANVTSHRFRRGR
ncbi:MAG: hypothetical protein PUA75_12345 [Clostridiales bacterium]|nr:hypothetical protein [Clostridiales bacterium]